MTPASQPFTIRSLANSGLTLEQVRNAVVRTPRDADVVLIRLGSDPVRFPAVCPNCDMTADSTIRVERVFLIHEPGGDDSPSTTVPSIDTFDIPVCRDCAGRRHTELRPASPWLALRRILSDGEGLGALIVTGIGLMFLKEAVMRLSLVLLVFASLPLSVGFWLIRSRWKKTEHLASPAPTPTDLAVDFTPVLSLPFEPAWRAFQFRSPTYTGLFRALNHDALWDPGGEEAQSAATARKRQSRRTTLIVGTIVAGLFIWAIRDDAMSYVNWLADLFR